MIWVKGQGPSHSRSMDDQNTDQSADNKSQSTATTETLSSQTLNQNKDKELDDLLDDALEDFDKTAPRAAKISENESAQQGAEASSADVPDAEKVMEEIFNDDFANKQRRFEEAMKHMLGDDSDLVQHFEKLAEMAGQVDGTEESQKLFTETLQKTLGSLAQNTENVEGDMSEDELMRMMSGMGLQEGAGEGDEGFIHAMQGMMKSLLSKDILYPSLKEISSKYPDWLSQNKERLSSADYSRYEKQHSLMLKVCQEFETSQPTDSDDAQKRSFEKVLDLMQQMQECGQPPSDIVGEMANHKRINLTTMADPEGLKNTQKCF